MSGTNRGGAIAIRLTLEGAQQIRRELEALGPEGQRALRAIDRATAAGTDQARELAGAFDRVTGSVSAASAATLALRGAAAGLASGGIVGALAAIARAGDEATNTIQRLTAATQSAQAAGSALQSLYRIALDTGASVSDLSAGFARFSIAAREVGATQRQVVELVDTLTKSALLVGSGAQEAAAASQQLGQALASGVLQGDELRSILENLPSLAERLARELGVSVGQLRQMGSEGQLTAERVLPALLRAGEGIRREFAELGPTMGRSFGQAQVAFSRLLADLDRAAGLSRTIARVFATSGGIAGSLDALRVGVGLGTEDETAQRDIVAARQAVARARNAQARIATDLERSLRRAEGDETDGIVGEDRRRAAAAAQETARLEAELRTREAALEAIRERARASTEAGDRAAADRGEANRRQQAEAEIKELAAKLDRREAIQADHAEAIAKIERGLATGAIDSARAQTLRAQADRERADALKALENAARGARSQGVLLERNPETGQSRSVETLLDRLRAQQEGEARRALDLDSRSARAILEERERQINRTTDDVVSYFGNAFQLAFENTEGGFAGLLASFRRSALSAFARISAEAIIRPIVQPIVASVLGGFSAPIATTAGTVLAGGSGGFGGTGGGLPFAGAPGGASALPGGLLVASGGAIASGFAPGLVPAAAAPGSSSGSSDILGTLQQIFNLGGLGSDLAGALGLGNFGGGISSALNSGANFINGLGVSSGIFGNGISAAAQGPTLSGAPLGTLSQSGLLGTTTLTGFLGAAGLGFGAGSLVGGLVSNARGTVGPGSTIGAGGGALAGAAIGSVVPVVGTLLGALIGGVVGGAGGGLIGPTRAGLARRSGGDVFYGVENGRLVITGARGKRFDEAAARQQVQSDIDRVNDGITDRGLRLEGDFSSRVGFGPAASASPDSVATDSLIPFLRSPDRETTRFLEGRARDGRSLETAFGDIDFIRERLNPLRDEIAIRSEYDQSLRDLAGTFEGVISKTRELGLATADLEAEYDRRRGLINDAAARERDRLAGGLDQREATLADRGSAAQERAAAISNAEERATLAEALRNANVGDADIAASLDRLSRIQQAEAAERAADRARQIAATDTGLSAQRLRSIGRTGEADDIVRALEEEQARRSLYEGLTNLGLSAEEAASRVALLAEAQRAATAEILEARLYQRSTISAGILERELRVAGRTAEADALREATAQEAERRQLRDTLEAIGASAEDISSTVSRLTVLQLSESAARVSAEAAAQAAADAEAAAARTSNATSYVSGLRAYLSTLRGADVSPLSAAARYEAAASDFSSVSASALAGDGRALRDITERADAFLDASRALYGSGAQYAADYSAVVASIGGIADLGEDRLTAQLFTESQEDLRDTLAAELRAVREEVTLLRREVATGALMPARIA